MKDQIELKNKKIPFNNAKKFLNGIKCQICITEFHCSRHNSACPKDFTCRDYLHHISAIMPVIAF